MDFFFKKIITRTLLLASLFTVHNAYSANNLIGRDEIFQKESKLIDYFNAKNKGINFYIFGEDYGNISMDELEQNKDVLNNVFDSNWVQRWVSDKQLESSDLNEIYEYTNNILNGMATNKTNENNVIAVNPIRINKDEDKVGGNNYWFNIIMFPKILFENQNCVGSVLFFSPNSCIFIPDNWNNLINDYVSKYMGHEINSDFVWSFISVHELSHSLPFQLNLRIFSEREDEFREPFNKYSNMEIYYKEVYADLYAAIKMLNYNYSKDDIKGIMLMRSFSLFLYDDIDHYSNPYLQLLLDEPSLNYKNLESLEDINDYINDLFIKGYNLGYAPDINLYSKELLNIRNDVRKFNSFLMSISSNYGQSKNDELNKFIKQFNTTVYFSNARLRVRMNNY